MGLFLPLPRSGHRRSQAADAICPERSRCPRRPINEECGDLCADGSECLEPRGPVQREKGRVNFF